MASMNGDNEAVGKKVRKISLEASIPKSSDEKIKTLRHVGSDSLALAVPTVTPKAFTNEKNHSSKMKTVNRQGPAMSQARDTIKSQTKKPPSGQRRKSSLHQGMVLDVAALHKLKKHNESVDRISSSSMVSLKSNPPTDPSQTNQHSELSRLSPKLCVSYSPHTEDQVTFGEGSDSSVYHSSSMYPQEEGPKVLGNLLEDPRKTQARYKRRMSSPTIQILKQQQDGKSNQSRMVAFPAEGRRHSTLDVPNISFQLSTLPSKSRFYSTQGDLTASSTPSHPGSAQPKDSSERSGREDKLTAPNKDLCGSLDSQTQIQQRQDSNKELADQNCRSNFGIVLSAICFVLFLWYLGMACSQFIKSALSFEPFGRVSSPQLGSVQEVVVYISAGDESGANTWTKH